MKTLAEIRQQFPQYEDLPDAALAQALHAKFYSDMPFEEFSQKVGLAAPKEEKGFFGSMVGGATRAGKGTVGLVTEALPGLVRGAFGDEEGARKNLEAYRARSEKAEEADPTQVKLEDLVNDFSVGKLSRFIGESIGEAIPSIATALVPAVGAGGVAARVGVGAGLKAAAEAGSKEATTALAKRVALGYAVGTRIGSGIQNIPESFANLNENPDQPLSVGPALLAGALKTALDSATPLMLLRKLHGPKAADAVASTMVGKFFQSGTGGALKGLAETMATEGLTEATQEAIDQIAANLVRDKEYDPFAIFEAGVKGGVGGAPFGAYAGLKHERAAQNLRMQAEEARRAGDEARAAELERQAQAAYEQEIAAEREEVAMRGEAERAARQQRAAQAQSEAEQTSQAQAYTGEEPLFPGAPLPHEAPTVAPGAEYVRPEFTPFATAADAARAQDALYQQTIADNERRIDEARAREGADYPGAVRETPTTPTEAPIVGQMWNEELSGKPFIPTEEPGKIDNITRNAVESVIAATPKNETLSIPVVQKAVGDATGRTITPAEAKRLVVEIGGEKYARQFKVSPDLTKRAPAQPFVGQEDLAQKGPSMAENPPIEPRAPDMSRNLPQNPPAGMTQDRMNAWVDKLDSTPAGTQIKYDDFKKAGLVSNPAQQRYMLDWAKNSGLVNDKGLRVTAADVVSAKAAPTGIPFMVTQKMKRDLSAMGYSPNEISNLTPKAAWDILTAGKPQRETTSPLETKTNAIVEALGTSPRMRGEGRPKGSFGMRRPEDKQLAARKKLPKAPAVQKAVAKEEKPPAEQRLEEAKELPPGSDLEEAKIIEASDDMKSTDTFELIQPLMRGTEEILAGKPVWEAPPAPSQSNPLKRMSWFNRFVNTLEFNAHKYPVLRPFHNIVRLRDDITQSLRMNFANLMHDYSNLKDKRNTNKFLIFADAVAGLEGTQITRTGDTLTLKFDPNNLTSSFLRTKVPENGIITLKGDEVQAYDGMRKALNLQHENRKMALMAKMGIPTDSTPTKLRAEAEKIRAGLDELPADERAEARTRARRMDNLANIIGMFDDPGFRESYLPQVRPHGENVVEFTATHPDGRRAYYRVDSPVPMSTADARRRAKELQLKVARRLGPEWTMSDITEATPDSLLNAFRRNKGIDAFSVVETLSEMMRTGANTEKIDSFLEELNDIRKKVALSGTSRSSLLQRKGVEGYIHEGNYDRYIEQVAYDSLSRSAESIGRNYTDAAQAQALADLQKLPDQSFLRYAKEHTDYMNSEDRVSDAMRAIAYQYTLGGSISAAVLNSFQTLQTTFPVLGAMYGYGKSSTGITRALADAATLFGKNITRFSAKEGPAYYLRENKRPNNIEPALWEDLKKFTSRAGLSPIVTDLSGGFRGGQNLKPWEAKIGSAAARAGELSSFLFTTTEQHTRLAAYISAWRAAQKDPKPLREWARNFGVGPAADKMGVNELAAFFVDQTQFNMSKSMRPAFTRGNLGVPFQFATFPVRSMELMARMLISQNGKKFLQNPQARTMFFAMLGSTAMQAGALGLPLVGAAVNWWDELLAEGLSKMIGEPVGKIRPMLQEGMAQYIKELKVFDDPTFVTNMILKGPVRELTGLAVEKRIGLDFPQPPTSADGLGPFGSAFLGAFRNAAELHSRGMDMLAVGAMMPPFFRNLVKAETVDPTFTKALGINTALGIPEGGIGYMGPTGKTAMSPQEVKQSAGMFPFIKAWAGFEPTALADRRETLRTMSDQIVRERRDELQDKLAQQIVRSIQFRKEGNEKGAQEAMAEFQYSLKKALDYDKGQPDPQKKLVIGDLNSGINNRVKAALFPLETAVQKTPKAERGEALKGAQLRGERIGTGQ